MLRCGYFFFKQKTAYEMRISDWSSDVCSSDLIADGSDILGACDSAKARHANTVVVQREVANTGEVGRRKNTCASRSQIRNRYRRSARMIDRKRVVTGKRVSVRVDLGGRRIIKKNTCNNTTITQTKINLN